ncbi:MAG: hypothetical protein GY868_16150 [Deltaproteobacteria bacterium]|nr:hypothetical protein [Deltaproteobacteria bacterium]
MADPIPASALSVQPSEHERFVQVSTDLLRRGTAVSFTATGLSMRPFINDGEIITVAPVEIRNIHVGDILLYRDNKTVIAHIVISIIKNRTPGPLFILRGDLGTSADEEVTAEQILGKVVGIMRGEKTIRCNHFGARLARHLFIQVFTFKKRLTGYFL